MHTKNQQEYPVMRLSAHGLQQLDEQGRQGVILTLIGRLMLAPFQLFVEDLEYAFQFHSF